MGPSPSLLIDIERKMREGKGAGHNRFQGECGHCKCETLVITFHFGIDFLVRIYYNVMDILMLRGDGMDVIEKVYMLMEQYGGYLTAGEARENGLDNKTLQRMAAKGLIERAAFGLYVKIDIIPDPFFVAQYRCPKGVFSHETALFLHDLSDRDPLRLMMTIPSGWNSKMLPEDNIVFFYSKPQKMELGICETETPSGVKVKVFDTERTLCDCLKNADKLDRDLVITALKRYVKDKNRDNAKLLDYATVLKIRDMVYRYLEVLT